MLQQIIIFVSIFVEGGSADYVCTGAWSSKAVKEVRFVNTLVRKFILVENDIYTPIPINVDHRRSETDDLRPRGIVGG